MKCYECGASMREGSVEHTFTISGVKVRGRMPAMICPECGENTVASDALGALELMAAHALGQHAVRTPEVFKFMRKALGLRAIDVCELLGTDPATVSRWERGHLDVDRHAFALLAALVEDRVLGKTSTEERLRRLANPPKVYPRELELTA